MLLAITRAKETPSHPREHLISIFLLDIDFLEKKRQKNKYSLTITFPDFQMNGVTEGCCTYLLNRIIFRLFVLDWVT